MHTGLNKLSGAELTAVLGSAGTERLPRPNHALKAQLRLLLADDSNRRWVVCSTSPPFTIGRSSACSPCVYMPIRACAYTGARTHARTRI